MSTHRKNKTEGSRKYTQLKIFGGDSLEIKDLKEASLGDNYDQVNGVSIKVLIKELYTRINAANGSFSFLSTDGKHNVVDPFTHMLITIYCAMDGRGDTPHWFFKYFKRMGVVSPLFVLFVMSVLEPVELKAILAMPRITFSNCEAFKKMCTDDCHEFDEECDKRETLLGEIKTAGDIESKLNVFIAHKLKDYIGDDSKEIIAKFGSVDKFEKWVKMVFEYTSMFTQPFMKAYIDKDIVKIKSIIEIFNDVYHEESKKKTGVSLVDSLSATIFKQQLYCKHLEYLTNVNYFSTCMSSANYDGYKDCVLDGTLPSIKPDNMTVMTQTIQYIEFMKGVE